MLSCHSIDYHCLLGQGVNLYSHMFNQHLAGANVQLILPYSESWENDRVKGRQSRPVPLHRERGSSKISPGLFKVTLHVILLEAVAQRALGKSTWLGPIFEDRSHEAAVPHWSPPLTRLDESPEQTPPTTTPRSIFLTALSSQEAVTKSSDSTVASYEIWTTSNLTFAP